MNYLKGFFCLCGNLWLVIVIIGSFYKAIELTMGMPEILKIPSALFLYSWLGMALYAVKYQAQINTGYFEGWKLSFQMVWGYLKLFVGK